MLILHQHNQILRGSPVAFLSLRITSWFAVIFFAVSMTGCGELEPLPDPEVENFQLTIDTLKGQVRDAQRNLVELRTELESRRQELADVQVARAQLEGRVREAERRLNEARHVIELQREELVAARAERERVFRSSLQLQNQLKQLQKHRSKSGHPADGGQDATSVPSGAAFRNGSKAIPIPSLQDSPAVRPSGIRTSVTPATLTPDGNAGTQSFEQSAQVNPLRQVTVKSGDTLWGIARKHRVSLQQLRSVNSLAGDQIEVGQILQLP